MRGGDIVVFLGIGLYLFLAELAALLAVELGEKVSVQIIKAAALSIAVLGVAVGGEEGLELSVGLVVGGNILLLYAFDLLVDAGLLLIGERNAELLGLLLDHAVSCNLLTGALEAPVEIRCRVVEHELAVPVDGRSGIALIQILQLADCLAESCHIFVKADCRAVDGHHGVLLGVVRAARRTAAEHNESKYQCDNFFHNVTPVV